MKNSARVLFLGAALALWATTLSAQSGARTPAAEKTTEAVLRAGPSSSNAVVRTVPSSPDAGSQTAASLSDTSSQPGASGAVSLVEISDMAIVESAALSAPFECDPSASMDELLASAREMFLADNYELAALLYKCLLRRDSTNLSAILELSVVYESMGQLQYAKGLITRAEILKPGDATIGERSAELSRKLAASLRNEVDSLITASAYEAALPKLAMLLGAFPDDAELYYTKARCYLALRNAEGALYEIEKAIRIENDPRFAALQSEARTLSAARGIGALEDEARSLLAAGRKADRDRALAIVSEILTRDPDHKWAKKQFLALANGGSSGNPDTGAVVDRAGPNERAKGLTERAAAFAGLVGRIAAGAARAVKGAPEMYISLLAAGIVLLLVFRSPLTSVIVRGIEPRHVLAGRLGPIDINAVFSIIHAQGGRGVLHVRSGPTKGKVYFVDGEIYHCQTGKLEGRDAVRRLLAQTREGHFMLTKLPRSYKKTIDVPFSLVLMDLGEKSFLETPSGASDGTSSASQKKSRMKSLLENKV